jgi:photosystem II stability/assembly factor-like uncharacterized protein
MKVNFWYICAQVLSIAILFSLECQSQILKKEDVDQLKFRHIGPVGNRVTCSVGIPGNDMVYISGAATGGIWKTVDGGLNWKPVFDDKPVHAIGALAIAPSDNQIVFAGTGESFIRSNVSIGNGVWKSTDQGETWQQSGLENAGRISRIIIHPNNPDIIYVCAVGHGYAPQKERGVHKSIDGGKTWKQVLFVDENTGASDLVMDPSNPRVLFAGMWQLSLRTWNRTSGGPGSGIHVSKDGGETWTKLKGSGLPEQPVGKIALAMTPADPDRIYALIETGDGVEKMGDKVEGGELWRSDDKGKSWKMINSNRSLGGRQAYYTRCAVSPDHANDVYFMTSEFSYSIDGGHTTEPINFATQPWGDHHDMWIDPANANRMIVSHDGGVSISKNRGKSWNRINLPIAQLYHVTVDNDIPYNVLTNRQDGPSMRGPSRSNVGGFNNLGITTGMWHEVGGGESGFATPDPTDYNIVWSSASGTGAAGGVVVRFNEKTRHFRQVEVWPDYVPGNPASEAKYRFQWTFPLLVSPHDHNTVYVTSQMVHRTTNGGQSWQVVSPDLTLNDKSKQQMSGGLTPDNIGVEYANVIYAFEESPIKKGILWAGTNDGQLQVSQNDGKDWTNVTKNIPEMPALGSVRNIEASKWSEGKAYFTIDAHEVGNFQPYVFKTEDFGKTWKKIVKGIEPGNLNYCRSIKEDPIRKGLLYMGTESTLYISFDDGENWQVFMSNLPHTPFYWIAVQEHFNDLVLATYGRGAWILDDLTPLQQLPASFNSTKAFLFKPKDTYRFQTKTGTMQFLPEPSTGQDPPYGVAINYWANSDKDSVKIYITSTTGDTLKTFKQKGKAGLNRVWWDLQSKPTKDIWMRTTPQGADWVALDKNRARPAHISNPFKTYLMPPGKYNVSMVSGDQKFTSSGTIIKDPSTEGSIDDVNAQTELLIKMHKDYDQAGKMVNEIELIRRQLYDLRDVMKVKKLKKLIKSVTELDSLMKGVEGKLVQLKYTGTGQDDVRYPEMIIGKIGYLANAVASADFAPADQHKEVYTMLKSKLDEAQVAFDKLMSGPFTAFMKQLEENKIAPIISDFKEKK